MDPLGGAFGGGSGLFAADPEAWYSNLPPVTRAVTTLTFFFTLLSGLNLLPAHLLILDWNLAIFKLQIWRFLTNIFFIGRFSLGWVLHMYMWTQVSSDLEANAVFAQSSSGAYLYFILLVTMCLCILSLIVFWPTGLYVHGEAVLFSVLYYWSRRETYTPVSISFLTVQGYQLPFVLMLLHLLMGRDLWLDAIGLIAGHAYYFFREILPAQGGVDLLSHTPKILDKVANFLFNSPSSRSSGQYRGGGTGRSGVRDTDGPRGGDWGSRYRGRSSTDGENNSSNGTQPFSGRGYQLGSS